MHPHHGLKVWSVHSMDVDFAICQGIVGQSSSACANKNARGLPQNLIGPPELTDLTFQLLHPGPLGPGSARRRDVALAGADGASAMRRRPRAGGGGAEPVPLKGGLGERPGLAEAVVGRLVEPGVERGRPSACPTAKPAAERPTAFSTVLRPARAAMTCRPRPWDGQRVAPVVAPVVPPAGAEVVPGGTVDRGDGAERRFGGHGPDCGGSP